MLRRFASAARIWPGPFSVTSGWRGGEVNCETRLEVQEEGVVCKRRHFGDSGCSRVEGTPPAPVPERIQEGLIYEEFSVEEYETFRESCTDHGRTGRVSIARCGSTRWGR
jgi:hypothetical protein